MLRSALTSGLSFLRAIFRRPSAGTHSRSRPGALAPGRGVSYTSEKLGRLYELLYGYYLNNGLYDEIQDALYRRAIWIEGMLPIRNPTNRVVEFYAAKLWPGGDMDDALPIEVGTKEKPVAEATASALVEAIQQVWQWSNFASEKQVWARRAATFGDLFVKVEQDLPTGRPYFKLIDPCYVPEHGLRLDRGVVKAIRIDTPIVVEGGQRTHTEYWDKEGVYVPPGYLDDKGNPTEEAQRGALTIETGVVKVWLEHQWGEDATLEDLGEPTYSYPLSALGIDFLPFVHTKFRDIGESRGLAAITHAIDKIDEANRLATRLHQMLFRWNKGVWAILSDGKDANGRPLPPVRVANVEPDKLLGQSGAQTQTVGELRLGDDSYLSLSGAKLESLVPAIDYASHVAALQAQLAELEQDLPELAYYTLRQHGGDLSGKAIRLLLSDAIDRLLEARGQLEAGLVRANKMALSIGIAAGLFPRTLGTYEAGDFEHRFKERDVITLPEDEQGTERKAKIDALVAEKGLGVSNRTLMTEAGRDPDLEETQREAEREAEAAAMGDSLLGAFDRGGRKPPPGRPAAPPTKK